MKLSGKTETSFNRQVIMELVEKHPEFKAGKVEDMLLLRMLVMVSVKVLVLVSGLVMGQNYILV